ncbi:2-polyprenyl-6-methoxyphenol hydroxylase-like FAD-dependent oxidoreductase [Actinomadura pelletieri DSM 43383]|uniref:2-polyprenyl-6-methoxyphenol hydroxylase-like FAD-dependent oxidoreductase n=1 Tax=Actinomadura pelletieri DSM 43383 TaxID=1120940 RepID=A0A495Q9M6_9ACTN|nr:FAD-dependent monooxygenase [Actinomadura pelletieri]RKS68193.1 2-polyprenyl-6-methoxyphenol hydroxylase-like FAD-dependent oxidoreductase [Actinomadura pelletieri DSM 43383]
MNRNVIIVGAGPAGLMLACELGTAGVETIVLERLPEPRIDSPGMAVNPTVVELLVQRGVMDALRGDGMEFPRAFFAHLGLDPTALKEPREYNYALPQTALERRLEEHAVKLGADVRRGHELVGLDQDDEGVVARVRTATGEESLRCRFLVGCDGPDSTVRRLAGIEFPGTESPFYGLIGELAVSDELFQRLGPHIHPGGLFTVSPSSPETLRVTTAEFGVEPPDRNAPVTLDELGRRIAEVTGEQVTLGEPRWLSRWFHVTRHAAAYRDRGVFLAGDAAHVHFPLGGQALSTGLEDAVDLGWKLAAAVHGWAPPALLDTYHAERHPVGARACRTTQAQIPLMHPMAAAEPLRELFAELIRLDQVNEHLVKLVGGMDVRYEPGPNAVDHPLVGHRLPDIPIETPDGPTGVAACLRSGRGVLLDLSRGSMAANGVTGWDDRVDAVTAEPTERIDAAALLLRPDGRVAWATATPDGTGLRDALTAWFGAANTGTEPGERASARA